MLKRKSRSASLIEEMQEKLQKINSTIESTPVLHKSNRTDGTISLYSTDSDFHLFMATDNGSQRFEISDHCNVNVYEDSDRSLSLNLTQDITTGIHQDSETSSDLKPMHADTGKIYATIMLQDANLRFHREADSLKFKTHGNIKVTVSNLDRCNHVDVSIYSYGLSPFNLLSSTQKNQTIKEDELGQEKNHDYTPMPGKI